MNIRNYIPNDHIMSVNETVKWQAQMIQLLTIEINDKDKQINELENQLKAYENMKKEMLEIINYYGITEEENDDWFARYIFKEFLNILNKVGGSDE